MAMSLMSTPKHVLANKCREEEEEYPDWPRSDDITGLGRPSAPLRFAVKDHVRAHLDPGPDGYVDAHVVQCYYREAPNPDDEWSPFHVRGLWAAYQLLVCDKDHEAYLSYVYAGADTDEYIRRGHGVHSYCTAAPGPVQTNCTGDARFQGALDIATGDFYARNPPQM